VSLYLCVFASADADEELEGVDVGAYDDFHSLRTLVATELENGEWGRRFPVLMNHPDTGPEWSPAEAPLLRDELATIRAELQALPPRSPVESSWQARVAKSTGLTATSLAECLIDVDGEPLLDRLIGLADLAGERGLPISFQ